MRAVGACLLLASLAVEVAQSGAAVGVATTRWTFSTSALGVVLAFQLSPRAARIAALLAPLAALARIAGG